MISLSDFFGPDLSSLPDLSASSLDQEDERKYAELKRLFDVIEAPDKHFVFHDKDHWFISFP